MSMTTARCEASWSGLVQWRMAVSVEQAGRVRASLPPNHRDLPKSQRYGQTPDLSLRCITRRSGRCEPSLRETGPVAQRAKIFAPGPVSRKDSNRRAPTLKLLSEMAMAMATARCEASWSGLVQWRMAVSVEQAGRVRASLPPNLRDLPKSQRYGKTPDVQHILHMSGTGPLRTVFARDRPGRSEG
jgi:hypothetical protein